MGVHLYSYKGTYFIVMRGVFTKKSPNKNYNVHVYYFVKTLK